MNDADLLCDTLLANGIDMCFANPITSKMHFVVALDRKPAMRCILGLSEGVVTGDADGYARMTDKPAATLLHLGPCIANGPANLHNARRARVPMLNVVGDHERGAGRVRIEKIPYGLDFALADLAHPPCYASGRDGTALQILADAVGGGRY